MEALNYYVYECCYSFDEKSAMQELTELIRQERPDMADYGLHNGVPVMAEVLLGLTPHILTIDDVHFEQPTPEEFVAFLRQLLPAGSCADHLMSPYGENRWWHEGLHTDVWRPVDYYDPGDEAFPDQRGAISIISGHRVRAVAIPCNTFLLWREAYLRDQEPEIVENAELTLQSTVARARLHLTSERIRELIDEALAKP